MNLITIIYLILEITNPFFKGDFLRAIKITYYSILKNEWWSLTRTIETKQLNYIWQNELKKSNYVAHALGNYEFPNDLKGAKESVEKGISFLEVDLFLDKNNMLRCHHGPDIPRNFRLGDCNFNELTKFIIKYEKYIVLDIKNHFNKSSKIIFETVNNSENSSLLSQYLIFQLTKPIEVRTFAKLTNNSKLIWNAPIITLHRTHTYFDFLKEVKPDFIKAITIPKWRVNEVENTNNSLLLMTHPLKSCEEYKVFRKAGFDGVYGESKYLDCIEVK